MIFLLIFLFFVLLKYYEKGNQQFMKKNWNIVGFISIKNKYLSIKLDCLLIISSISEYFIVSKFNYNELRILGVTA